MSKYFFRGYFGRGFRPVSPSCVRPWSVAFLQLWPNGWLDRDATW